MNPEAVIFDLDGVITDTAHLHFHAWRQVASEIGIEIDEAFNNTLKGISRGESLRRILHFGGREADFSQAQRDELATRKNSIYVESLNQLTAQSILPGIHDLLLELKQRGIPTGLASVSLNAPTILKMLGITELFTFCADAGKIARSKPDQCLRDALHRYWCGFAACRASTSHYRSTDVAVLIGILATRKIRKLRWHNFRYGISRRSMTTRCMWLKILIWRLKIKNLSFSSGRQAAVNQPPCA